MCTRGASGSDSHLQPFVTSALPEVAISSGLPENCLHDQPLTHSTCSGKSYDFSTFKPQSPPACFRDNSPGRGRAGWAGFGLRSLENRFPFLALPRPRADLHHDSLHTHCTFLSCNCSRPGLAFLNVLKLNHSSAAPLSRNN